MKKILALLVVLSTVATMAVACKKDDEADDTTAANTTAAVTTAADGTGALINDTVADDTEPDIPAEPAEEIKYGTPTIDGVIDDAFKASAVNPLGGIFWNAGGSDKQVTGNTYFLWDEQYLYAAVEVKDPVIVSRGADYYAEVGDDGIVDKSIAQNLYKNDSVELWFLYNDESVSKVHADAEGLTLYTTAQDAAGMGKKAEVIFDITKSSAKTAKTADGYVIEMALKLDGNVVAENEAGIELKFALQVNDISALSADDDNGELGLCCWGSQRPEAKYVFAEKDI